MTRSPALLLFAAVSLLVPSGARGQDIVPAVVGGMAGLGGGTFVSAGIVTLQARRGRYLYSADDALDWKAAPILVGAGAGAAIGLTSQARLRRTLVGGVLGGGVGAGIGALLGRAWWEPPEGKWAGGVIGGAAGLLVGSVVGVLWRPRRAQHGQPWTQPLLVPVGVRVPL